ncbi:MXAN_6230/SCO0854 family RING domain-containing protein [Kitasatospora sp. NPDC058965]|uniref:MXAN_6230/SCO0854 family RING domain-containing protein n=1 Tax=Kitasatospora sp. NPDC058965 TaxID=3346682 RepID=UPI0036C6310E
MTPPARSLTAVLLARRAEVYLNLNLPQPPAPEPEPEPEPAESSVLAFLRARQRPAVGQEGPVGVALLDADLVDRGYLLAAPLRQALAELTPSDLAAAGKALLADVDAGLGANRTHRPLFQNFPEWTPDDPEAFYLRRVLSLLFQHPEQPCVLCGTTGTVHAVAPCAHLVCHSCFDGAEFAGCPICHRRLDPTDPFLKPAHLRTHADPARDLPQRLRVLAYGGGPAEQLAAVRAELATLLARPTALRPQDLDDLAVLLDATDRTDLDWLPAELPGRETKAVVLARLLTEPADPERARAAVEARLTTATDVLRLASVLSGGDAGLLNRPPRYRSLPRPVRRTLLTALDRLAPTTVAEEMRRHRSRWLRLAELLHVFEHADRHPRAALAVAALRGTDTTAATGELRAALQDRVLPPSWGSRLEAALRTRDHAGALAVLTQRPGELLRRLDLLLRLADTAEQRGAVLSAAAAAATRVSAGVLLSTLGALRSRLSPRPRPNRVFFPKGGNASVHVVADERPGIPRATVEQAVQLLTDEALRRAAAAPPVERAVIDAELTGIVAPFGERTASRALVTVPRGSELSVPEGRSVRLFLHWTEDAEHGRVDLDLSLAMFDADWRYLGTCDYTALRFGGAAAVHSGDLTSAPPPDGATEFVDLDLELLLLAGARYVVAVCFSYNNVAFDDMAEAFAGVMVRSEPGAAGPVFDPRAVEQRFDLVGRARASVPLVLDTAGWTMRWLDITQGVTGSEHAVQRHQNKLAVLGQELTVLFDSGARVGLAEVATWHAAARARTVLLRHADGTVHRYTRRPDEAVPAFAARIGSRDHEGPADPAAEPAQLAHLLRGDLPLAPGAEAYALHPAGLDAARVRLLTAADVVTALAPDGPSARPAG